MSADNDAGKEKQVVSDGLNDIAPIVMDDSKVSSKAPASSGSSSGLAKFTLLLTILLGCAVCYLAWYGYGQQQAYATASAKLNNENRSMKGVITKAEKMQSDLTRKMNAQRNTITSLQASLTENKAVLEGQGRRLLSLTATTTDDWRLAEVEYLLQLANQRVLTSKDAGTATQLLAAADKILLELGDPRLFTLREAIAEDRAKLALIGKQDLEGVFLRLSAIANQVDGLPLLVIPSFSEVAESKAAANVETAEDKLSFQQQLLAIADSTWVQLRSLVIIQQRDELIKPLLPPEQKTFLRANLKLLLNQAQLALLGGKQALYQDSLLRAKTLVNEYFPLDQLPIQAFIDELASLSEVTVEVSLPDVHGSIIAIKAFIADLHRLDKSAMKPMNLVPAVSNAEEEPEASADVQQEATL